MSPKMKILTLGTVVLLLAGCGNGQKVGTTNQAGGFTGNAVQNDNTPRMHGAPNTVDSDLDGINR